MSHKERLRIQIEDLIKEKKITFPELLYENKIQNWWFDDDEIKKANSEYKLLTLDLDVGTSCHYNCCFCFASTHRKEEGIEKKVSRIKEVIDEAAGMGLKTIKIVGAGEPTLFPKLLEIVIYAYEKHKVRCVIFTTGDIFGNDELVSNVYKGERIDSGIDLAKEFYKLGASIVVKYMTLNRKKEMEFCGIDEQTLINKDKGLLNLIKVGFNKENPTRLGVDFLLLKGIKNSDGKIIEGNYKEAVEAFAFFNQFNIFMVLNTSMDCGLTLLSGENTKDKKRQVIVLSEKEAQKVAEDLYLYAKKNKIPFDERISPYFLSPVCSQLNHGLYVTDDMRIKSCPGQPLTKMELDRGIRESAIGRYEKEGDLIEAWRNNPYKHMCIGHKCPSRSGKTYFKNFEERIKKKLYKK